MPWLPLNWDRTHAPRAAKESGAGESEVDDMKGVNNDMKGAVNEAGLPPDRPTLQGRQVNFMRRLVLNQARFQAPAEEKS